MLIFFFTGGGAGVVASVTGVEATGGTGTVSFEIHSRIDPVGVYATGQVGTAQTGVNIIALPAGVQARGYVSNLIVWGQDIMSRPGADIWAQDEIVAPLPQPWQQIRPSANEIWKEIVPEDLW